MFGRSLGTKQAQPKTQGSALILQEAMSKMKHILLNIIAFFAFAIGNWSATPALAQYDWTGIYLGGQIGAQWVESRASFNFPGTVPASGSKTFHGTGFIGGGQVGFNWQPSGMPLAMGLEGDVIGASHDHSGVQGSVHGRLGWAINRVLLYGTAGAGFGHAKLTTTVTQDTDDSTSFSKSETLVGWSVGAGVEYALPFSSHWLLRAEYRYTDLGSIDLSTPRSIFPVNVGPLTTKADFRTHDVILGIDFKF